LTSLATRRSKIVSRRKPPSVGSSSRFLSSPRTLLAFVQVPLGSRTFQPASGRETVCSRLTLTSCVAGHFETQLSTEIVLLGSVANARSHVIGDLPVVLFVYPDVRQRPRRRAPLKTGE